MLVFGMLRACWPVGLAFVGSGTGGLILVIGVQFGLIVCMGVYNPVYATYRLEHTEKHLVSRVLAAWSVSSSLTIAALTALWGVLASLTSPRVAIAAARSLADTPVFLLVPRRESAAQPTLTRGGLLLAEDIPRRPSWRRRSGWYVKACASRPTVAVEPVVGRSRPQQALSGRPSTRSFDISDGAPQFRCHGANIWPRFVASLVKPAWRSRSAGSSFSRHDRTPWP